MLITHDGKRGLLIDWELSKRVSSPTQPVADQSTNTSAQSASASAPSTSNLDSTPQPPCEEQRAIRQPDRTASPCPFFFFSKFITHLCSGHMAVHLCTVALATRGRASFAGRSGVIFLGAAMGLLEIYRSQSTARGAWRPPLRFRPSISRIQQGWGSQACHTFLSTYCQPGGIFSWG